MKKLFKVTAALTTFLLLFAACSTTTIGTTVGTVNGKEVKINYYDEIFKEESSDTNEGSSENNETSNNITEEQTSTENEEVEYDDTSAMLMSVFGKILEETGNTVDKKKLNAALNNVKGQYGDSYLSEAESNYQLPIKTEKDLVNVLTFSLSYSGYLEKVADITDGKISEEYYKSYQTKYCASHILVESKEDAQKLLSKIESGEKTFADYTSEAQAIYDAQNAETTNTNSPSTLTVNDAKISDVNVKQFADLDCAAASNYVGEFGLALESMDAGTVSAAPVKTEYGYHIIDLREVQRNELTKEIQDEIKSALLQAKQQQSGFSSYYLKKLVDEVQVDITDEKIKKLYDDYIKSLDETAVAFTPEDEESTINNEASSTNNETSSTNNNEKSSTNNN